MDQKKFEVTLYELNEHTSIDEIRGKKIMFNEQVSFSNC